MSNPQHGHAHHPENGHAAALAVDLLPAGAKDSHKPGHHGHTIVPLRLLVGVLVILLVFTVLTVSAANAEEWFSHTFNVEIPGWVNAVVALSIACVKSIIVAMYFMQLRYDQNPMNALVCVFTIMVATFFLGFIAIDLGNRGIIYQNKGEQITPGGIGGISRGSGDHEVQIPAGTPIAVFARQRADAAIDQALKDGTELHRHSYKARLYIRYEELEASATPLEPAQKELAEKMKAYMDRYGHEFEEIAAEVNAHSHHEIEPNYGGDANTANSSRPGKGITLTELGAAPVVPLFAPEPAPAHEPKK